MTSGQDVSKIVIHYKDKRSPRVIKDGLALYTTNNDQDAMAEFVGIDNPNKMIALLNAVGHSLKLAHSKWSEMEAKEKESEGHKKR